MKFQRKYDSKSPIISRKVVFSPNILPIFSFAGDYFYLYLAVRRVTQINKGKTTAGIDGVKSLTPAQRLKLANELEISGDSKPVRRIWIPKAGKTEKRPKEYRDGVKREESS